MSNTELAKEYLRKAYSCQLVGKNDEAIINYKLSIQLSPTAEAYTFLGYVYGIEGRYEEAIKQCKLAIEKDKDFGNPYNDIGYYLMKLGDFENAIDWFKLAIKSNKYDDRYKPYFYLGKIYSKRYELDKAINYFKDCLRLKPDYLPAKQEFYKAVGLMN
jgi:tetratricopeptide (TPR) repeat protein